MATRKIVPRADNEGGIGTTSKKWASVWATLVNALTLAKATVGFTIAGGDTSKTLTVSETTTLNGGTHSGTNTGDQTLPVKASSAEINTGTDDAKFVTADGFAGSDRGKRIVQLKVFDDATAVTTGDGKIIFMVPVELNGMNLVDVEAFVTTNSSSGTPTVQIRNVTDAVDILSTRITIDINEPSSLTAATAPVIDTTKDDVATGDLLAVDVDVAGTGAKGLGVLLSFSTP